MEEINLTCIKNIKDIKPNIIFYRDEDDFIIRSYYYLTFYRFNNIYKIEARTSTTSKSVVIPIDYDEEDILEVYNKYVCELTKRGFKPLTDNDDVI